jgi:hypothetical protein
MPDGTLTAAGSEKLFCEKVSGAVTERKALARAIAALSFGPADDNARKTAPSRKSLAAPNSQEYGERRAVSPPTLKRQSGST